MHIKTIQQLKTMLELSPSEKKLIEVYKKLRLKEIYNKNKLKEDLTLTEQSILIKENEEVQREIKKVRNHFTELFYRKWVKQWDDSIEKD